MSGRCEFASGCRLNRSFLAINLHSELVEAQVASRGVWLCESHARLFARDGSALVHAEHPFAAELHSGQSHLVVAIPRAHRDPGEDLYQAERAFIDSCGLDDTTPGRAARRKES